MKKIKQIPILIVTFWMLPMLLAWFTPDFCYAVVKWRSIGPEERSIYALAIDPSNSSIVYAGTMVESSRVPLGVATGKQLIPD